MRSRRRFVREPFPSTQLRPSSFAAWPSLLLLGLSLIGLAWFNAALYGHAAATASYNVDVSPGPVSVGMLFQFTRGVLGWLLDHQRGLLVAAPIYFVAFIGLGQWLWRRSWAALVVALPFAVALGSTALVGGFWIGIEPAARYLVYVLPPLGAALAYAWVHRRGPWLAAIASVTLAFSLWTAFQVIQDPLLAQTHDLIGERLPGLVPFLPALGKPAYLSPGAPGELSVPLAGPPGQPALWRVPARGRPAPRCSSPRSSTCRLAGTRSNSAWARAARRPMRPWRACCCNRAITPRWWTPCSMAATSRPMVSCALQLPGVQQSLQPVGAAGRAVDFHHRPGRADPEQCRAAARCLSFIDRARPVAGRPAAGGRAGGLALQPPASPSRAAALGGGWALRPAPAGSWPAWCCWRV